jgi:hypothetical protein
VEDFFSLYKQFTETNTEAPPLYHKWCSICAVAATLGKNFWFPRGHFNVYPNQYVMLIGSPGTGKGTSIGIVQGVLLESGYDKFAADKSSKEKFLIDFQEGFSFLSDKAEGEGEESKDFLGQALATESLEETVGKPKEVFIMAEEFNDFIGINNTDFIALLTRLWSYTGTYRNRLKNSRSISIYEPCINILGGNTSVGFSMAFPPEVIGQGFLARLLPIYGEPTGKKISFPTKPSPALRSQLSNMLRQIRQTILGEARTTEAARIFLDKINQQWKPLSDLRFQHYASRRFTHLLKLCLVFAAARLSTEITLNDIKEANTILTITEELMPKAVGEFGKARNADVASKIMESLHTTVKPLDYPELWKLCSSDLNQYADLAPIMFKLSQAGKVIYTKGQGFLPKVEQGKHDSEFMVPTITEVTEKKKL